MVCYVNDWFNPSQKKKKKKKKRKEKVKIKKDWFNLFKKKKKEKKMYNFLKAQFFFSHIIIFPKLIFKEK